MSQDLRARIDRRASELGHRLQPSEIEQLTRYLELLARWNGRINLTALPLDDFPPRTLDRLIMEPLVASAQFRTTPQNWFDFGSGGGSPALPLKILRPASRLTMVESRARKCAFLREVARQLQLPHVLVELTRVEEIVAGAGSADVITIRALRLDESIARQAAHLLKPNGSLLAFASAADSPPIAGFSLTASVPLPSQGSVLYRYQRLIS